MHPGREADLVTRQTAICAKPTCRIHISMMREIAPVGLLEPQRDGLGDQFLELDIILRRDKIYRKFEIASDARAAVYPLWQQHIAADGRIKFYQPVLLDQTALYRPHDILRTHRHPLPHNAFWIICI